MCIERLKELCSARGIKVAGKAKDELVALLAGKMAQESTRTDFSDSLMKMVLQMQEQQLQMQKETRTWIAQQQERQEKLMKAVIDRSSLSASGEDGVKKAKLPKPTLQKLAPSDDIESFIDMFERVATQQGRMADGCVAHSTGRTLVWRCSRCIYFHALVRSK